MSKAIIQAVEETQNKSQTVTIQLQLEPVVLGKSEKAAKDDQMTYAELATSMLEKLYSGVLGKADQIEEIGWGI